ncbi:MAG TPA: TonB-dependent receptor [Leadbetterella sp.]|nr:TonB-dependent receptor [Leadbetterella sp.]
MFRTIALLFLVVSESFAFTKDPDTLKIKTLEPVNVTAMRSALKNSETPARIFSFSKTELQTSDARSMPEFFNGNGNYFLQKTNHGGGSVFLRGLTGNQTLILVDGIRLNNSTFRYGPNQYLNTINPFMVSNVEVLSGSGSVQYGSDAIGGLIQVFSNNPNFEKKFGLTLNTRISSQNMEKGLSGAVNLTKGKFGLLISGTVKKFGDLVGGKNIGRQEPNGYDESAFEAKGIWNLSQNLSLTLAHQHLAQKNVPIYHKVLLEDFKQNEISFQARNLSFFKLDNKTQNRIFSSQNITLSYQYNPEERTSQKNNSALIRYEKDQINTSGFSVSNISLPAKFWTISSGIEAYDDKVYSSKIDDTNGLKVSKRGLYPNNSSYFNSAVFSLHQFSFKTFHVHAGLRWNTVKMQIPDETLGTSEVKNSALVYNFSVLKKLGKNIGLYSSFNTAFRAPNIDDMGTLGIVDFRYEIPSDNLKPEKSKQFELGLKGNFKQGMFQINVFQNQLEDLITREKVAGQVIETYQVYAKMNTGKAIIKGLEWSSKNRIIENLYLSTFLTYTYGQDLIKNEPLRRMPPFFGNFAMEYALGKLKIKPSLAAATAQKRLASGDIADNRIGKDGTSGFAVFNMNANYELHRFQFNINVLNLGNKAYKTHGSGVYGYGRSAFGSVSFNI